MDIGERTKKEEAFMGSESISTVTIYIDERGKMTLRFPEGFAWDNQTISQIAESLSEIRKNDKMRLCRESFPRRLFQLLRRA